MGLYPQLTNINTQGGIIINYTTESNQVSDNTINNLNRKRSTMTTQDKVNNNKIPSIKS